MDSDYLFDNFLAVPCLSFKVRPRIPLPFSAQLPWLERCDCDYGAPLNVVINAILGQSLKNLNIARKDVVIATKVYSRVGPGRNDIGASRGHIMDGVEASLRRLQTDHIDLYQKIGRAHV